MAEQGGNQIIRNAEAELPLIAPVGPNLDDDARSPTVRASSCARWWRATRSWPTRWDRNGSPTATTCPGARRPCAPSWPGSRSSACSSIRTPRPGRVPTDTGYRHYVDELLRGGRPACAAQAAGAHRHAARGGGGHARHHRAALPGDQPAGAGVRAADRHRHDPSRGGASPAAAGGDGGGDHVHRRRDQADHLLRRAAGPRPGGLGRQLPQRDARRDGRGRARAAVQALRPRAWTCASARSWPR